MSSEQGARIFDVGYRSYDGPRSAPVWALVTVWKHTLQRVLGLHRSFRHKVLPAIAVLIAFLPALPRTTTMPAFPLKTSPSCMKLACWP